MLNDILIKELKRVLPDKRHVAVCTPDVWGSRRHRCKIPFTCAMLKEKGFQLNFTLQLNDPIAVGYNMITLDFSADELLLEPSEVSVVRGDNSTDSCYLPFFSDKTSAFKDSKRWVLGTFVLRHYYTVFDGSAVDTFFKDEIKQGYNRIGMIKNSHDVLIGPGEPRLSDTAIVFILLGFSIIGTCVAYCICYRRQKAAELNIILE